MQRLIQYCKFENDYLHYFTLRDCYRDNLSQVLVEDNTDSGGLGIVL